MAVVDSVDQNDHCLEVCKIIPPHVVISIQTLKRRFPVSRREVRYLFRKCLLPAEIIQYVIVRIQRYHGSSQNGK